MSTVMDIVDAVVDEINGASWSRSFEAVRSYRPKYDRAELEMLRVVVVPGPVQIEMVSRAEDEETHETQIAVMKRLPDLEVASIDPLIDLVEEIADHFSRVRLAGPAASCVSRAIEPLYGTEELHESRVFVSVIRLEWIVRR